MKLVPILYFEGQQNSKYVIHNSGKKGQNGDPKSWHIPVTNYR